MIHAKWDGLAETTSPGCDSDLFVSFANDIVFAQWKKYEAKQTMDRTWQLMPEARPKAGVITAEHLKILANIPESAYADDGDIFFEEVVTPLWETLTSVAYIEPPTVAVHLTVYDDGHFTKDVKPL